MHLHFRACIQGLLTKKFTFSCSFVDVGVLHKHEAFRKIRISEFLSVGIIFGRLVEIIRHFQQALEGIQNVPKHEYRKSEQQELTTKDQPGMLAC